MRTLIIMIIATIIMVVFVESPPGKYLQNRGQVYLSMYLPISKKIDLKSAQITHMDGTPIKVTLSHFEYNPLGTTGGYVDSVNQEMYLNYRNPNNATPTILHETLLHELFHSSDVYHNLKKYCKKPLTNECAENKAYDFTHLYNQMLELERQGWLEITK